MGWGMDKKCARERRGERERVSVPFSAACVCARGGALWRRGGGEGVPGVDVASVWKKRLNGNEQTKNQPTPLLSLLSLPHSVPFSPTNTRAWWATWSAMTDAMKK